MLGQWLLRLLLAGVCIGLVGAAAGAAEVTEIVAAVEQGYRDLDDLQADFSQRTTVAAVNRTEKGNGVLYLRRGTGKHAQFRFNYAKPAQQIVSNGKTVWYYVPESKQVIVSDVATLFSGGNSLAVTYLTGMGRLSRDFSARSGGRDRQGNHLLELTPKSPSAALTKLQLTVAAAAVEQYRAEGTAKVPFPILSSVVTDGAGNRTEITYGNLKVNRGLGADRFTFSVPAGVAVVKQ